MPIDNPALNRVQNLSLQAFFDVAQGRTEASHFEFDMGRLKDEPSFLDLRKKIIGCFFTEEVWNVIIKPALERWMEVNKGKDG